MKLYSRKLAITKVLTIAILILLCSCDKGYQYPKDFEVGEYLVTSKYVYENGSETNLTRIFTGPVKTMESLIFTNSSNGYVTAYYFEKVGEENVRVNIQIEDMNNGNQILFTGNYSILEHSKNHLKVSFTTIDTTPDTLDIVSGEIILTKQ